MSIRTLAFALVAAAALPLGASAQTLKLGDPAPRIQVKDWVRGEPVKAFQEGKPYVVEFWATWCAPCIKNIPHLTELQKKYADQGLTVLGVSIRERDWGKVEPFVKSMGDKMDYRVATDSNDFMASTWLDASGAAGIPTAFLVDRKGRIAWTGHPAEMDEPLAQLMAGTLDVAKARELAERARELETQLALLQQRLGQAMGREDYPAAVAIVDDAMKLDERLLVQLAALRFDLLLKTGDFEKAYAYGREAVKGALWDDPGALNSITWVIVDPRNEKLKVRDLELALLAAKRIDELTEHKDYGAKDTLARVHFTMGKVELAVKVQREAIELAPAENPAARQQLQRTLSEYEKALEGAPG